VGHLLTGVVRAAPDCRPLAGAQVELWPEVGNTHPAQYRATVIAGPDGSYLYQSPLPDHIHMLISAPGYYAIFYHYHPDGRTSGTLDLTLLPDTAFP
jgi:hypothetical protein